MVGGSNGGHNTKMMVEDYPAQYDAGFRHARLCHAQSAYTFPRQLAHRCHRPLSKRVRDRATALSRDFKRLVDSDWYRSLPSGVKLVKTAENEVIVRPARCDRRHEVQALATPGLQRPAPGRARKP